MSATITQFHSMSAAIEDSSTGLSAWAFSIPGDRLILCAAGEVSVVLTAAEQAKPRSAAAWNFLFIARGVMAPTCYAMGAWMAAQQEKQNTISDRESGTIQVADLIEYKTENKPDEDKTT